MLVSASYRHIHIHTLTDAHTHTGTLEYTQAHRHIILTVYRPKNPNPDYLPGPKNPDPNRLPGPKKNRS